MTIILTCRRCNGAGKVPNEHFEIVRKLKSDEAKRHFHVHARTECLESDSDDTLDTPECGETPEIPCPQCDGEGELEFDEDAWEVSIVSGDNSETADEPE